MTRKNTSTVSERGDATREKLLTAAIDVFGRHGFSGTTTRALAQAAGVNLQAIPYYFGGKRGLYLAAAEHMGASLTAHTADARARVRARLEEAEAQGTAIDPEEVRALLTEMLRAMAMLFVGPKTAHWARFMIHEQTQPTEAFRRIFEGAMKPLLGLFGRLVGLLLDEDPLSEHVRLRTMALIGGLLVFRAGRAAAMAHLGWETVGPREVEAVSALAAELAASIQPRGDTR